MSNEAFMYLIKHEFKWWGHQRKKMNWWALLYSILGIAVGLIFFTFGIRSGHLQFRYLWFFTFAFPFIMMGMTYASIAKEWKNRMYGWWLSLPYSRERLIMSKFIAAWLQTLIVFLCSYGFMALSSLYAVLISDHFTLQQMVEHLVNGLPWMLSLLAFYPIVAAFSFLTFIGSHTKYSPITPLLWIILIISINGLYWLIQPFNLGESNEAEVLFSIKFSSATLIAIVATWLMAWGLLKLVARWLERDIKV